MRDVLPAAQPPSGGEPPLRRALFTLAALGFVGAGISHVVRGFAADPADPSSPARHALFVGINALAALGLTLRPRWLVYPFACLAAQQLGSHGGRALASLQSGSAPGAADAFVTLGMPLVMALLVHDAWWRRRTPAG